MVVAPVIFHDIVGVPQLSLKLIAGMEMLFEQPDWTLSIIFETALLNIGFAISVKVTVNIQVVLLKLLSLMV